MPNQAHRQSQALSQRAAELMKTGRVEEARSLYLQAATLESEALEQVETGKSRARGILTVSLVSQYYKAQAYEQAKSAAHLALSRSDLPDFAQEQLQELLGVIWEEEGLKARGLQFSGETIMVSLRGNGIGTGRAPASLVSEFIRDIEMILYRITELLSASSFRRRGRVPRNIRAICQPWITQPQAGSFRCEISLVQNEKLGSSRAPNVTPKDITERMVKILQAISNSNVSGVQYQSIEQLIPNREYRQSVLKTLRNIVPDGETVSEIEFTSLIDGIQEKAFLRPDAVYRIDNIGVGTSLVLPHIQIREVLEPPNSEHLQSYTIRGVLKALDLETDWLEIVTESGERLRCYIEHAVLDDVVEHMVNQRVVVSGRWEGAPRRSRFRLFDIEIDSPEPEK